MLAEDRMKSSSSQFAEHLDELEAIQANALEDILPAVLAELKADREYEFNGQDVDASASEDDKEMAVKLWLEDWLNDLGQIYRVHKKQDYDTLATLDAIHRTLVWRAKNLANVPPPTKPCSFLRFLPHPLLNVDHAREVGGNDANGKGESTPRPKSSGYDATAAWKENEKTTSPTTPRPSLPPHPPILFLSLKELTEYASPTTSTLEEKMDDVKAMLIHVFEVARLYLGELDWKMKAPRKPDLKGKRTQRQVDEDEMEEERRLRMLQFVLMVDVQGAGMLPNLKILARISFPSGTELLEQFPPEFLLEEHGGTIPSLSLDYDPITARYKRRLQPTTFNDSASSTSTLVPGDPESGSETSRPNTPRPRTPKPRQATESTAAEEESIITTLELPDPVYLDPFSPHNPFYGYPTVVRYRPLPDGTFSAVPHLVHGRRRKRDLFRALAFLFIIQWRKKMGAWIQIIVNNLGATRTRVRTTARRNYLTFKTIGKILGLDAVAAVMPSSQLPAAVMITGLLITAMA
ncbi:hypothetical protein FRC01_011053, partial [Tulasnella sp. 417]